MWALYKKEIKSFLHSLVGYIVIAVYLMINGLFLWVFPMDFNILDYGYANIDGLFILSPFVFMFLIPAITMRSFSEEKRSGSMELLMTKPITDFQIIIAKYLADLTLVIIAIMPTMIYFISVYMLGLPVGNIDVGGTYGSYIGLIFLGAAFVSIGIFTSSLTDNQIISFILSMFLCLFFYLGFELISGFSLFGQADLFIRQLGINTHYVSMSRGVIDTRDVIYFLSLTAIFIVLTRISLESRKWK